MAELPSTYNTWTVGDVDGHINNTMLEPTAGDFERVQVDAAPSFRFDRIVALLAATPKHDLASFERVMADTYSMRAHELVPMLTDVAEIRRGVHGELTLEP